MKKLIILGLNSDLGDKVEDYFSSLYSEVIRLSINNHEKWLLSINESDEIDIVDCHVYSGKHDKLAYTKLHNLIIKNTRCYICISTNMHGKDKSLFLSSYRKLKLQQEKFLLSLFERKLVVIRSYDILDSKNWKRIKDSDSVYKLSGVARKQINIIGLETRDLLEWIASSLENKKLTEFSKIKNAYLVVDKDIIGVLSKIKYLLKCFISKSILVSELRNILAKRRKYTPNNTIREKQYFIGGFLDL